MLAHMLKEYEIKDIVVSPGSRNAPIAIHLAETEDFNCYSIVDERSAAFVALGMSQSTKKPTAITCTSGSAAANYYPAITEAFYQNIPMLVLTADRPTDFVDLFDGQTIRQNKMYQQHSYGDFELMEDGKDGADEHNWETIKKAIELCYEKQGPVHINIPLEEPLYNLVSEIPFFPSVEKGLQKRNFELSSSLVAQWNTSKKIMILVGTHHYSYELESQLSQLVKNHSVVVLSEVNSNLSNDKFFRHIDRYLYNFSEEDFANYGPDLLITVGQNVVSKKVKAFLRKAQPKNHWHIDEVWQPDTYFSLTEKLEAKAEVVFNKLLNVVSLEPSAYYNLWDVLREKQNAKHEAFLPKIPFSDFSFFKEFSEKVPSNYAIHFSNSSAIRYAQLFDFQNNKVYCNRGTSGIEGCTSTAMGFSIKNNEPTVLVSGDVGFFYDINGLWNQYIPPFTRIIVFNNGEGNIFKIIPGPDHANSNILDEFIATKHHRSVEGVAKAFGFGYVKVDDQDTMSRVLDNFFKPDGNAKILEVDTSKIQNSDFTRAYFENLK